MRPVLLILVLIVVLPMVLIGVYLSQSPYTASEVFAIPGTFKKEIRIGGLPVLVSIADTDVTRVRGLSGTTSLPDREGLLMIFDADGYHRIWMKDMRYAIDIIWISEDGYVVDIAQTATPESYPKTFGPQVPARYVLEVPAGFAEVHGVSIGNKVNLGSIAN